MTTTALITGASKGIGYEMAQILHQKGYNLVLVARTEEKLKALKSQLTTTRPEIEVTTITCDLSKPSSAQDIFNFTQQHNIDVDILVNNAGCGYYNSVVSYEQQSLYDMHMLNIHTLVTLCTKFGAAMQQRQTGRILNITSLAAFQPVPFIAAYAASKAYVLNFSEALAMELKPYNISVSAFAPGHTDTDFFDSSNIRDTHSFYHKKTRKNPKKVARRALESMFRGKLTTIDGLNNSVLGFLNRLFPRSWIAEISCKLVTPS